MDNLHLHLQHWLKVSPGTSKSRQKHRQVTNIMDLEEENTICFAAGQ